MSTPKQHDRYDNDDPFDWEDWAAIEDALQLALYLNERLESYDKQHVDRLKAILEKIDELPK